MLNQTEKREEVRFESIRKRRRYRRTSEDQSRESGRKFYEPNEEKDPDLRPSLSSYDSQGNQDDQRGADEVESTRKPKKKGSTSERIHRGFGRAYRLAWGLPPSIGPISDVPVRGMNMLLQKAKGTGNVRNSRKSRNQIETIRALKWSYLEVEGVELSKRGEGTLIRSADDLA